MLGINPGELTARNSEAYWTLFHFGTKGYKGWPGILEIFLKSEWSTSPTHHYANLVQNIFAFKAALKKILDCSGIEEAYIGRPYISCGKTIDLKT